MTGTDVNPNEKLLQDIEFLEDFYNKQKEKEKTSSTQDKSWVPEQFYNTGDSKSKERRNKDYERKQSPGRRYKTQWESGKREKKDVYGENKSTHYYKFKDRRNENSRNEPDVSWSDRVSPKPYMTRQPRRDEYYNETIDNNEDRRNKTSRKPFYRNENQSTSYMDFGKWGSNKYTKKSRTVSNVNKNEKIAVDRNGKASSEPPDRVFKNNSRIKYESVKNDKSDEDFEGQNNQDKQEVTETKHIHFDNELKSEKCATDDNTKTGIEVDKENTIKFRKRETDGDRESRNQRETRKLSKDRDKHFVGSSEERTQKRWDDKKDKTTNWKWEKRGRSPSDYKESTNSRYRESGGRKFDRNEQRNRFNGNEESEKPYYMTKSDHELYRRVDKGNYEPRRRETRPDGRQMSSETRWHDRNSKPTNWKWGQKRNTAYESRSRQFEDSRGWKQDRFEGRDRFRSRNLNQWGKPLKHVEDRDFKMAPRHTRKNSEKENDDSTKDDKRAILKRDMSPMSFVKRRDWGAPKTKWGIGPPLEFPLKHIFCLPTEKRRCFNLKQCTQELLYLHKRHTCTETCPDIKYSFFIGTDGTVYECRGWRTRPGLPKQYEKMNKNSLFIALAGTYNQYNVPPKMVSARDYVIRYGVRHHLIDEGYSLHSAVDHPTQSMSGSDKDEGSDSRGDGDSETHDQEDREDQDQGQEDQEDEDQESEFLDSKYYETDEDSFDDIDSKWEDDIKDEDLGTASGSSVRSWESYSSSWDLKTEDLEDGSEGDMTAVD